MCGRFVAATPPDQIARYFDARPPVDHALMPSWNVAPTDDIYVVLEAKDDGERRLTAHHWGLVPFWAKSPAIGAKMINARAEGLAEKGAFKAAFAQRRCLVPADGFYEWRTQPGTKAKQAYFIHRSDGEPLAFAGLWEQWRGPHEATAQRLRSATVITTAANRLLADLHDRMPVILPASRWAEWLDPANADVDSLGRLLVPVADDDLTLRPVGPDVGNVRNNRPQLIAALAETEPNPVADDPVQLDLGVG